MEQEMKYSVGSRKLSDSIWEDPMLMDIQTAGSAEAVVMKAVYFDTKDMVLAKNNMTVRVRAEGEKSIATLKWGGNCSNGFHERNEVNVPVSEEESLINPSAKTFKDSDDGKVLLDLIGEEPLINLMEMRFLRKRARLNYKGSLIELALDQGSIITDFGEIPISEMELELYAGEVAMIKELGNKLSEKYDLSPEVRSKFSRGYALIESGLQK